MSEHNQVHARAINVCFFAYAISPLRGSEAGNSWTLAMNLVAGGDRVTVVTSERYSDEWPSGNELPDGLSILTAPWPDPLVLLPGRINVYYRYLRWQWVARRLVNLLIENGDLQADIVHHFSWGSLYFGSAFARIGGPMVFGPVGGGSTSDPRLLPLFPTSDRMLERIRTSLSKLSILNPLARSAVKRSTVTLAANRDTASIVARLGGRPSVLLPDSIGSEWLASQPRVMTNPTSFKLIWVARFLPIKGATLAVKVLALLPTECSLEMYGDGPDLPRAKALAAELGIGSRITFYGTVERGSLVDAYDRCDALLFTSVRDSFGVQILEATARGLPVLGIQHQGIGDHLPQDAGVLVESSDPEALAAQLASAVVSLYVHPERYNAASAAALSFAKESSSANLAQRIHNHYESAISLHHERT